MMNKKNNPDYIFNPVSGRYVLKSGSVGKKINCKTNELESEQDLELHKITEKLEKTLINDPLSELVVKFDKTLIFHGNSEDSKLLDSVENFEQKKKIYMEIRKFPTLEERIFYYHSMLNKFPELCKNTIYGIPYNSLEERDWIMKNKSF